MCNCLLAVIVSFFGLIGLLFVFDILKYRFVLLFSVVYDSVITVIILII